MYYVYIIANTNNTVLYVGVTNDIARRMYEHKNHLLKGFSDKYNCEKLVYLEITNNIKNAIVREKQLKGWRRSRKEDLINSANPNWNDLSLTE